MYVKSNYVKPNNVITMKKLSLLLLLALLFPMQFHAQQADANDVSSSSENAVIKNKSGYYRIFAAYTPTIRSVGDAKDFYEGLQLGCVSDIRLSGSGVYYQIGAQFDWLSDPNGSDELGLSVIPLGISYRFNLAQKLALSPFVDAVCKFNLRHSGDDMTFQPGLQFGLNLDYKRFYFGVVYHAEFFTKEGLGHTRGLSARIGVVF